VLVDTRQVPVADAAAEYLLHLGPLGIGKADGVAGAVQRLQLAFGDIVG
jgi:hypothetical protein